MLINCFICHNLFYAKLSRVKRTKIMCCSLECRNKYYKTLTGKKAFGYIDGKTLRKYYCIDCNRKISLTSALYGSCKCNSCEKTEFYQNPENTTNWQGGKSFEEYGAGFDNALKEQVRFRDKYKCRECGCSQVENGKQLDCHHIDYNKKNNDINNLTALCIKCHRKTNYNRKYWQNYLLRTHNASRKT